MKQAFFTLTLALFGFLLPVYGQQVPADYAKAAKTLHQMAKKTIGKSQQSNFRSQYVHQPDSMTFSFWQDDKQTAQTEINAAFTWKQSNGAIVIDRETLYQEGVAFGITYAYNATNQVTGGAINVFLGPIPIPAGALIINRDSRGNITRTGVEINVLGNEITEGDSSAITYNAEDQMESVIRYFYDSENENGAGWYLLDRYDNLEYCQDGSLCAMTHVYTDDFSNEEITEIYTELDWYEDASDRFLASLLPAQDEYALQTAYAFFPADPKEIDLLRPIAAVLETTAFPGGVFRTSYFTYNDFGGEWLCTVQMLEQEGQDPILVTDYSCYSFGNEGRLEKKNTYADEDLQVNTGFYTYSYNDYGYVAISTYSNGMDMINEENVFEVDGDNRLRKIDYTYNYQPELGEPIKYGTIAEFFYKSGSSTINSSLIQVFEVFPNPAESALFVALKIGKGTPAVSGEIRIRNLAGELLHRSSRTISDREIVELSVANLPSAVYILEFVAVDGQSLAVSRFIKK
jgi:hypothetical protein